MRLIILSHVARKFSRTLFFLTKPDHIPILKKFNQQCTFIPYVDEHTTRFNNFTRKCSFQPLYDLKYLQFLREEYFNDIFNAPPFTEFSMINGCMYDIKNTVSKFLISDYNDGQFDTDIINSINIDNIPVKKNSIKYGSNILSINIKINNPDNKRIYDLWDKIIPKLKRDYNKDILLISGNNDIKEYLGKKHQCLYEISNTETNYSNVRGNYIVRGKADAVYNDVITCSATHFIPFVKLREDYPKILSKFTDLNFVTEKTEKFDILVEYLAKYIILVP